MKKIVVVSLLALVGCASLPNGSQMPAGTIGCSNGIWGQFIIGNINPDVVGTKGGGANIKCPAGEITFTDAGNLPAAGQSVRVPVEATPMKLSPK